MKASHQPLCVLIIDEDRTMSDLLKMSLEQVQYEIIEAGTGAEGLEAVRKRTPDVIILDLPSPGLDSWHMCKAIREFSQAPILVLSAFNKPSLVASTLDGGADDFLLKPVATDVLKAHLKRLTRRAQDEKEAAAKKKPLNKFACS